METDPADVNLEGGTATLVELLKDRARMIAQELAEDFNAQQAAGASFDEALNSVATAGWHATECHCHYVMAKNALEAIPKQVQDPNAAVALIKLLDLGILQIIKEGGADFSHILDRAQIRQAGLMVRISPKSRLNISTFP